MPVKRTGISKFQSKMQKTNETEFSRELSAKNQQKFEKMAGVEEKLSERPGYYGIYPGE